MVKGTTFNETLLLDIFLHIFILITFLTGFFIFVLVPLERSELKDKIESNVNEAIDNFLEKNDTDKVLRKSFCRVDNTLENLSDYYGEVDTATKQYNKSLIRESIIIVVMLAFSFLLSWGILKFSSGRRVPVLKLLASNVILFSVLIIIEFLFFVYIAKKYIPIKPSLIVERTISDLKNI